MKKEKVKEALKKIKESSKKRNFKQSIDLVINIKGINLKKPEEHIDTFAVLHYPKGRDTKICAFVGPELIENAKANCDLTLTVDDFSKYEGDKKKIRKLANSYDFFIAQANVMPKIAQTFGKVFGPKQKMPNPKAGCVVPPNANLAPLVDKLKKTVRLRAKTALNIQCIVGNEEQSDVEVIDNIMTVYRSLLHHLPHGDTNVRNVMIKLCMSEPVVLPHR